MTPVEARLVRRIALTGPITVADYMAACLTDPDGYYATRDPFGAAGDFVTAPEVSQMFGELVGAWLVDRWMADGRPACTLAELGPGRGTLMADVLSVALRAPGFADAVAVTLVEASPRLRDIQRARLEAIAPRLVFADTVPDDAPLYLVANEFFDALPVRQLVRRGGRWFERVIGLDGERLSFGLSPFPILYPEEAPDGAVRELRPAADAIAARIGAILARHGRGAALVIDYGYDAPTADGGETLQAVKDHRYAGLLETPGASDLSAHVDFSALAQAAEPAVPHGPVGQGDFLLALGLAERAGVLGRDADADGRAALTAAVHRLAGNAEGEMGDLFRVLALTPGRTRPPGFATAP